MELLSGRRGGRASDKAGARDMAMDVYDGGPGSGPRPGGGGKKGVYYGRRDGEENHEDHSSREEFRRRDMERNKDDPPFKGKDEYRDEAFETEELARGKQEDSDATTIERHGRWGSRASDKAGARDIATDPPVSEPQRKAMQAAAAGHSTLGIPQKVGAEFAKADPGGKLP